MPISWPSSTFQMKLLPGILLLAVCIGAFPDGFDDEEDEIDETSHLKPRVAWVPIVQRNVSAAVREALLGEKESKEKLNKISKMLEDSYDTWIRDTAEGDLKIRQLEQRQNSAGILLSLSLFFSLFFF